MKRMTRDAMTTLIDGLTEGDRVRVTLTDSTVVEGPVFRERGSMFVSEWLSAALRLPAVDGVPFMLCHIERV